jgi:DNA (cytosine-5)-methyltransferase 1
MGFDAKWGVVSAADIGANHQRERIWIRANANSLRKLQQKRLIKNFGGRFGNLGKKMANTEILKQSSCPESTQQPKRQSLERQFMGSCIGASEWWLSEPNVGRVADGISARVDRLKAIGNAQVPLCAATAWELLK